MVVLAAVKEAMRSLLIWRWHELTWCHGACGDAVVWCNGGGGGAVVRCDGGGGALEVVVL